jgi:hypothetical protein
VSVRVVVCQHERRTQPDGRIQLPDFEALRGGKVLSTDILTNVTRYLPQTTYNTNKSVMIYNALLQILHTTIISLC